MKNNSKVIKRYVFYKLQFYAVRFIYLKNFLLIPVVVSELCPGKGKSYAFDLIENGQVTA